MKRISRVRSTFGRPVESSIGWMDDEIHPYFVLDRYIFRDTPHGTFTQPVNRRGVPVGHAVAHANLPSALAALGWEVVA